MLATSVERLGTSLGTVVRVVEGLVVVAGEMAAISVGSKGTLPENAPAQIAEVDKCGFSHFLSYMLLLICLAQPVFDSACDVYSWVWFLGWVVWSSFKFLAMFSAVYKFSFHNLLCT